MSARPDAIDRDLIRVQKKAAKVVHLLDLQQTEPNVWKRRTVCGLLRESDVELGGGGRICQHCTAMAEARREAVDA